MKLSIKKIFRNITLFMSFALLIAIISVLFSFDQENSFKKINLLNTQKTIASTLYKLDKKDLELTLIQYNGKSTQLRYQIEQLYNLYKYDKFGNYILNNSEEYFNQLKKLTTLVNTFNTIAQQYYKSTDKTEEKLRASLDSSYTNLNNHISSMIFKNIEYDNKKFELLQVFAILSLIIILIFTYWYHKRLSKIYEDISFLYSSKIGKTNHELHTLEADAIYLRMKRKPEAQIDPSNIDPITGINNNKGLKNSYAEKKGMKDNNFTAVAVLEIDNFSKTNRAFPQELTQSILKKIASTISLYERVSDVIARSDYNQFTIILSRKTKEQAFKEIDSIRQSISELKIKAPTQVAIQITVSGGFCIKPNNITLNSSIDDAKSILEFAKKQGKDKIYQKSDMLST